MSCRCAPFYWVDFSVLLLSLANGACAASAPAAATPVCTAQAEGFLNARLAIWQQRMNLEEWKISIEISHPADLKPRTLGNIHWDTNKKAAVIRVLNASDYQVSCREALSDMELTVVHELVHLELSSLPRSQASRREEEFAVNRIAGALIQLDRQKTPANAGLVTGAGLPARGAKDDEAEPSRSRAADPAATGW